MSTNISDIERVIKSANEDFYNWFPLIKLLSIHIDPESVAKDLLSVHFHLTRYIVNNPDEVDLTIAEISTLQDLYIVFTKITKKEATSDDVKIQFIPNNPRE